MTNPEWLKPGIIGAVIGAIVLAVVGFSWAGWVTESTANKMASDQARLEVVAALVPICLEQSKMDPAVTETLAQMKETSGYKRADLIMNAGWATMPGAEDPNRSVASACVDQLEAQF